MPMRHFRSRLAGPQPGPGWGVLALLMLAQSACLTSAPGGPYGRASGHYRLNQAPVGIDSPSATCRNSLSACAALYGKEVASVGAVLDVALDAVALKSIEEVLEACANFARTEVLSRYKELFGKPSPTAQECMQETKDARGRRVTWAIRLGLEMHEAAQACVQKRLGEVRPGGFSLEQRYRPDLDTHQTKMVSREEEQALEESGNGGELKGTLKPDVVIHQGNPLRAQAVYDFKFPCVSTDSTPRWHQYPDGHPFADFNQGEMYHRFIAIRVGRVSPWIGIIYEK